MISLRYRIAVMLAMAAIGGIIFSAPISVCLILELACMLAVGRETFGRGVKPVWWAGVVTLSVSLILTVITPYI
jgi:hypothetical protein